MIHFHEHGKGIIYFNLHCSVGRSGVEAKRNDARRGMRMINFIGSAHDSATSINKRGTSDDSRALVAVPNRNMDALAVAPPLRRPKRSETAQRRIRRPFSVSEVEALVQAVEKLGTGRWRDVKLRAFDNAKHRTYVDLKICRTSGKHWYILQEYPLSKDEVNRCPKSYWTGS
ncbi:unnamed protein product [Cuscuta epithymum]|uniref:HTH myb-type domain-containing protein n=1 Tax=Cuscuta epithymum TaxID=186058 RepID=A0AAV0F0Z6_9ASTE|nr:unnamed protein product [Cuscuta epithymum]